MTTVERVLIVGGGPGGLVLALALRYGDLRRRHLRLVARRARQLSRLAHLENPAAVALRNAVLPAATDGLDWLAPVVGHETRHPRS